MKFFSLLRASLTEDMNLFKFGSNNSSRVRKIILPIVIFGLVCFSMGTYAYLLAKKLAFYNLTYIMLTMFLSLVTGLTFIQGIYKSQGILFESKNNDLLFSLPISKKLILFIRVFKLILFQYIYNSLFLLPAYFVYIYFERPSFYFYVISLLMFLLLPLIPTIISSIFGYLIKLISSKFKSNKIIQTILSFIIFLFIFFISMNSESFINNVVENASSINDVLTKIYFPIGVYISLLEKFDLLLFIKLLFINIILFFLFIFVFSSSYFKIISSLNDNKSYSKNKVSLIKVNKPIMALVKKEIKRYLSSPVYMFNTSFGQVVLVVLSFVLCFRGKVMVIKLLSNYGISENISVLFLYYGLILFSCLMTSITSSSISLEGRSINITKSLPISIRTIFNSKILYCYFIELPFVLVSVFIFSIKFRPGFVYLLLLLLVVFTIIFLSAVIGLVVNLKYPKLNYTNDTEIVKQSMSSMISIFINIGICLLSIFSVIKLSDYFDINFIILINLVIFMIISIILYIILIYKCPKDYMKLNV